MHEYQPGIRIDGADCGEREQVVGAFHHPSPHAPIPRGLIVPRLIVPGLIVTGLMLQMLEKSLVECIGWQMTVAVQPPAIRRDTVRRVETQAAEDMRGDLAALL